MTDIPAPTVRAARYEVSCVPEGHIDSDLFTIHVEATGLGRWAVRRHGRCLNRDGVWGYEPIPSSRRDDWLDEHRFDLDTATALAVEAAPQIRVNGFGVADIIAKIAAALSLSP